MADLTSRILVVIDAKSAGAVQELNTLQGKADRTGAAFDTVGRKAGLAGAAIKTALVAGAGALVGGGLIAFLNDSVQKFAAAQDAAAQFARATNATVVEAGKFTTVARSFGLEMNDLIEINAEFSKKIQEQPELLKKLNVEVAKNADGSVNMTQTLVATIDALGNMENGLEAAQIAAELFGEEGSKQLAGFYLQGIKVSDLMDKIDFIDKSEEAKRFAASTAELGLSMESLQIKVGAGLVPVLNDLIDAGLTVFDFFTSLPGPVVDLGLALGGTIGGFVAFNKAMEFFRSAAAGNIAVGLLDSLAKIPDAFFEAEGAAKKAGVAVKGAAGAFGDFIETNRVGIALTAAAAYVLTVQRSVEGVEAAVMSTDNYGKSLRQIATDYNLTQGAGEGFSLWLRGMNSDNQEAQYRMEDVTAALEKQAVALLASEDATVAQRTAAQNLIDTMGDGSSRQKALNLDTEEGTRVIQEFTDAVGGSAAVIADAQAKTVTLADGLADIVANGGAAATTWADIASAAADAAAAQSETKRVTELTTIAMGEYAVSLQEAVGWAERLAGIPKSIEEAKNAIQDSYQTFDQASGKWQRITDDAKTAGDEGVIAASNLALAVLDYVDALAAAGATPLEITTNLEELRGTLPADLQYVVDDAIAAVSGTKNDIPVDLTFDVAGVDAEVARLRNEWHTAVNNRRWAVADAIEAELNEIDPSRYPKRVAEAIAVQDYGLAEALTADYNAWALANGSDQLTITYEADGTAALGVVEELTGEKSATVTVDAETGAAQGQIDGLTGEKSASLTIAAEFTPGGYNAVKARIDYLMAERAARIGIDTEFSPGGYTAVKSRVDWLARQHLASIKINTAFEPGGYNAVKARVDYLARDRTATITVNQVTGSRVAAPSGQSFALQRSAPIPNLYANVQPTNVFRVNIDGMPLRAWIRDEVGRAQPAVAGVA